MVLVSVIMGAYNHERFLSEAIKSVLDQTFHDLELIIVDDYSIDHSRNIILSYQQRDTRVKAIFHDKNMGIARGVNDGLKEAKGKYVGFIGSDDVWVATKLEKQLQVIRKNENKVLWSEGKVIDAKGSETGQVMTQLLCSPRKKYGDIFEELLHEDFIFGQSTLLKTEFAQEVTFNEHLKLVNDHLFFVELAKNHQFIFMPEPLAKYRLHGNNSTLHNKETWFKERIMLRNDLLTRYGSEISNATLADIYYKIGHAYSGLNQKNIAKQYYLKAIRVNPLRSHSALFLILALTNGEGFVGELLQESYHKVTSSFLERVNQK